MTVATIPLLRDSLQAIQDAGTLREQLVLTNEEVDVVAKASNRSSFAVSKAIAELDARSDRRKLGTAEEALLANRLDVDPAVVRASLQEVYANRTPREVRSAREALGHLVGLCIALVGLFVVKYWFTRGVTYYMSRAAHRLASDLRIQLFEKLQRLPVTYFNEKRSGAIQSVLTTDVNVFQTAVTIIRDSLEGPVKMVAAFGAILFLQWQLGLVSLLVLPIMIFAIQRNAKRMRLAQRRVQERLADVSAMTHEALQGTRVVKAFNAEAEASRTYSQLVEQSFSTQMRAVGLVSALRPLVELIGAIGLAVVLIICGWLAYSSSLQVADIAAIVYALDVINQGFRNLASVNNTYASVQAASERIYEEILDVPEEHVESRGDRTLPSPQGRIGFEAVSFRYPDGTEAVRDVSFNIEPGEAVALVGSSGAGKSTLADLLLRFYDPTAGRITFDGIDIRELELGWLRSQIGVVPQQTFLFAGTIADNVRLGKPDATVDDIAEAIRAAHADEFVVEMDEGLLTPIHERGVRLSGGQMQRVAIARALVRKPTILLLDEATSALDAHSEKKVQEALDSIMDERTTLFIAHRLTTAARADRIVVLGRGEVLEQGSHRELMERNGSYASMVRAFGSGGMEGVIP